jgi:hypothetical protein
MEMLSIGLENPQHVGVAFDIHPGSPACWPEGVGAACTQVDIVGQEVS